MRIASLSSPGENRFAFINHSGVASPVANVRRGGSSRLFV
jgi:hypothetical protein